MPLTNRMPPVVAAVNCHRWLAAAAPPPRLTKRVAAWPGVRGTAGDAMRDGDGRSLGGANRLEMCRIWLLVMHGVCADEPVDEGRKSL
jgi:hypothetical protein